MPSVFILSAMRSVGKKSQQSPKGSNLWPPVSACTTPTDPNASPVATASPNVHIMPGHAHSLTMGRARNLKCNQSGVQGFSSYQLCARWAKKSRQSPKGSNLWPPLFACTTPMDPNPSLVPNASPNVHIMPGHAHSLTVGRARNLTCNQSGVQGFSFYQLCAVWAKKANNPSNVRTCGQRFSPCTAPMDPKPSPAAAAPPNIHIMPVHVHSMPMCRTPNLRSHQAAVRGFHSISYMQYGEKEANNPQRAQLVPSSSPRARPQCTQFLLRWLLCPLTYTSCPHMWIPSPWARHGTSNAII